MTTSDYAIHLYIGPKGSKYQLQVHLALNDSDYGVDHDCHQVIQRVSAEYKQHECMAIILYGHDDDNMAHNGTMQPKGCWLTMVSPRSN